MPECCKACVCSEEYGCGITGTEMTTKEMESRPDWCPLEEVEPCGDAVSRQAAIDALDKRFDSVPMEQTTEILMLRKDLRELPSAQPEQRWIPCKERLPEEDHWLGGSGKQFSDDVLISILNSDDEDEWVDVSYTIDGEWTLELPRHCKILAWMPLPEPYREEGGE